MEIFKDNYKPIQIRIQDSKNNEHLVSTKIMTLKRIKKIEELKEIEKGRKERSSDIIYNIMEIIFDKPKEFWNDFSLDFLMQLIDYVNNMTSKKKDLKITE